MVKVYMTPTCPWCKKTIQYLESKNVDVTTINVAEDEAAAEELEEISGQRGVPVTTDGDDFVVGFDKEALDDLTA